MPANTTPIFPLTPRFGRTVLVDADTSYTAPTTKGVAILVAGANGTRIDGMKIRATGTNSGTNVMRVFVLDNAGTPNYTLVHELALAASTASATAITGVDYNLLPLNYDNAGSGQIIPYLPAGHSLVVSIGSAATTGWAVSAYGGDY